MSKAEVLHWTPTDYLSDYKTRRLTLEEHGAYMLLLWHMWNDSDSQCEFPRDPLALASVWSISPEAAMDLCDRLTEPGVALVKVIERKSGAVLQSKRLREQASAFENARQKNAKAGRQSGVVRRANAANNRSTDVQHMLNESEPTVVPCLGSPDVSELVDQTPVSSRSSDSPRTGRGSYPQADEETTIAYYAGKLHPEQENPELTADETRSAKRWVREYGTETTRLGIGYAAQDGFVQDPKRVYGQIRALAKTGATS